jgi:uncharacterized membrane protein
MTRVLPISVLGWWIALRSSFWFLPALMVVSSIGLAVVMIYLDRTIDVDLAERYPTLFGANASGARSILSAIASSMITVAGVTFSITIVSLSIASNQYTPRILRNFMRDTGNQLVLGIFVSVFVYSLIVLRAIRGGDESFVPSYSVIVAIGLSIAAIGFLIFFVHHVANMVQASTILMNIYEETKGVIEALYPDRKKESERPMESKFRDGKEWAEVLSSRTGYIQAVDERLLIEWAKKNEVVVEMVCGIGAFIAKGAPLLKVHGRAELEESPADELNGAFTINKARTVEQDPEYGIRQMVDVALKALSPGINDTTSAATALDYLGALIFHLGERHIPPLERCEKEELRLVACGASYQSMVDESFHEIRQHAAKNVAIYVKLLDAIGKASRPDLVPENMEILWRHAELVARAAAQNVKQEADRDLINDALVKAATRFGKDHRPYLLAN